MCMYTFRCIQGVKTTFDTLIQHLTKFLLHYNLIFTMHNENLQNITVFTATDVLVFNLH